MEGVMCAVKPSVTLWLKLPGVAVREPLTPVPGEPGTVVVVVVVAPPQSGGVGFVAPRHASLAARNSLLQTARQGLPGLPFSHVVLHALNSVASARLQSLRHLLPAGRGTRPTIETSMAMTTIRATAVGVRIIAGSSLGCHHRASAKIGRAPFAAVAVRVRSIAHAVATSRGPVWQEVSSCRRRGSRAPLRVH